jgi:hypothetical protein
MIDLEKLKENVNKRIGLELFVIYVGLIKLLVMDAKVNGGLNIKMVLFVIVAIKRNEKII